MPHFDNLQFERKCPTGLRGGRAPNLDVVLSGPGGVVGIESKLTEPPVGPPGRILARLRGADKGRAARSGILSRDAAPAGMRPDQYTWLDAAQVIKHAFGLARSFPDRPVTLLYLFWEPANPTAGPEFVAHRDEIDGVQGATWQDHRRRSRR